MSKDDFDPRFDPAFQPGFVGETTTQPKRQKNPAQVALEAAREQAERAPLAGVDAQAEPEILARRINPFLVALGVLAFTLIMGGVQGIRTVQSVFENANLAPDIDYTTISMLSYGAPLAIALGVAIVAGLLFVYASAWQRRV